MSTIRFEWDEKKNIKNKKKHNISFEEATSVFADDHALLIDDPDHSDDEDRFILLGLSSSLRVIVVCHCYCLSEDIIRIISARKASKKEREIYNKRWIK